MSSESSVYEIPYFIGVVGHRDLVPAQLPAIRAAVVELLSRITARYASARPTLLCSMAEGADLLVAEAAAELGLPILALFPYAKELCRADLKSEASRALFDRLCAKAESRELSLPAGAAPADLEHPGMLRDRQFQRAGAIIARYSALLITIWDGLDTNHKAGTARVVESRRKGLVPTDDTVLLPRDALLSAQDNDLMFEIRCSRTKSQPGNGRGAGDSGVVVRGLVGNGVAAGDAWPSALTEPLERFSEFNRDVDEFGAQIEKGGRRLSIPSPYPVPSTLNYLDRLFTAADWLGNYYRRCFTRALKVRFGLWSLMALLLIAFKHEAAEGVAVYTIFGVLGVFAIGFGLANWAHRRSWHRKYLDYRALAEGLRVDFYWEIAGVRGEFDGEFAHETFLQKQDVELQWIRNAMRAVSVRLAMGSGGKFSDGFPQAFAAWIGDDDPVNGSGQLQYYRQRIKVLERNLHRGEVIGRTMLFFGMALAVMFAVDIVVRWQGGHLLSAPVRDIMLWGLALNTVYAAVFEIYLAEKADRGLVRQYRYMYSLFGFAATELRGARTDEQKLEIMRSLGHACLAEHAQWILAHRDRRIEGLRW